MHTPDTERNEPGAMEARPAVDQALTVAYEDGCIVCDGPGGVALTLTLDAAHETANRLLALIADVQRGRPG